MFNSDMAMQRFGCGLSKDMPLPASAADLLDRLSGVDEAAKTFPIMPLKELEPFFVEVTTLTIAGRQATDEAQKERLKSELRKKRRAIGRQGAMGFGRIVQRRVFSQDGLRERLAAFWADHFTAVGTNRRLMLHTLQPSYVEDAIRPHVTGRFVDMLRAVIRHPLMLHYLDQLAPIRSQAQGLNENLARELLELHTLGVAGPYAQEDVVAMSEILSGLSYTFEDGFHFNPQLAQPGAKQVLGQAYGPNADITRIDAVLEDLAHHPVTARHLAQKMARHFVGDAPAPELVDHMASAYRQTLGDLLAMSTAMIEHPKAWEGIGNVKPPLDYITSALRALDLRPSHIPFKNPRKLRQMFLNPLVLMGQDWGNAPGPDGWPEDDKDWITPQRLAVRLQ